MTEQAHSLHAIRAPEDVGALRRAIARLAATHRGPRPGRAELVATELATNLLRHADPGGYALYRPIEHGIELLAVDSGPGMSPGTLSALAKPVSAVPDPAPPAAPPVGGHGAGLSAGLPAVRRMSSEFDFFSTRAGTVLLARLTGDDRMSGTGRWRYGAVNVPLDHVGESGDAWAVSADGSRLAAVVVDGLGHGPAAAAAAHASIKTFDQQPVRDVERFLRQAHEAMLGTRGGVVGVCLLDAQQQQLNWAGIGNIAGQVRHGADTLHLLSRPGTLGTHVATPRAHVQRARWAAGSTLVITTDGVHSGWDPTTYPGLLDRDPTVIAAVLHRDYTRSKDDATVLVVQDRT